MLNWLMKKRGPLFLKVCYFDLIMGTWIGILAYFLSWWFLVLVIPSATLGAYWDMHNEGI